MQSLSFPGLLRPFNINLCLYNLRKTGGVIPVGIRAAIESGEFIVTGEVAPPKGWQLEHMLEEAEHYRGLVAGINVTDLQSAVMRTSSLVGCINLK